MKDKSFTVSGCIYYIYFRNQQDLNIANFSFLNWIFQGHYIIVTERAGLKGLVPNVTFLELTRHPCKTSIVSHDATSLNQSFEVCTEKIIVNLHGTIAWVEWW